MAGEPTRGRRAAGVRFSADVPAEVVVGVRTVTVEIIRVAGCGVVREAVAVRESKDEAILSVRVGGVAREIVAG